MAYTLNQVYYPGEEIEVNKAGEYKSKFLTLKTLFKDFTPATQSETNYRFENIEIQEKEQEGGKEAKAKYVGRQETKNDYQVTALDTSLKFYDDCLVLEGGSFDTSKTYYFHGKIKRMRNTPQTFYIKLKYSTSTEIQEVSQYIKTVIVANGDAREWVDVEFIFTPLLDFDALSFELQREARDYREETRFAIIAYLELSEIQDLEVNDNKTISSIHPKKIGVQSHPGLLMCINGEEIRIGNTGIYELKSGIITTDFFAVVHSANELPEEGSTSSIFEQWKSAVNDKIDSILLEQSQNPSEKNCYVYNRIYDYYEKSNDTRRMAGIDYYNFDSSEQPQQDSDLENYYEMVARNNQTVFQKTTDTEINPEKIYYKKLDTVFISDTEAQAQKEAIHSVVFCRTAKKRTTSKFVLDYMY